MSRFASARIAVASLLFGNVVSGWNSDGWNGSTHPSSVKTAIVRVKSMAKAKMAIFRFYAELNDCLPQEMRAKTIARHSDVSGTVKDFIESFGVPHTEVD